MIWLKGCPRCLMGDLMANRDVHGWYVLCFQCGYMKDLDDSPTADTESVQEPWRVESTAESTKEAA